MLTPNTHKCINVLCPNPRAAHVLNLLLEAHGSPTWWAMVDGRAKVVTMANHATVMSCIESINSFAALVGA